MNISNQKLDREAFRDIFNLMRQRTWIQDLEEELMNLWELCDSTIQRDLLKELILDIYVLDNAKGRKACDEINQQIKNWNLTPENTFIVAVADVGKPCGSLVGIQQLKLKVKPIEAWEKQYVSHIPEAISKLKNGDSVVLFDDFIGSGKKMADKFKWFCDSLNDSDSSVDISTISFYFVAFSGMTFGLNKLKKEFDFPIYTYVSLDKGISDKNSPENVKLKISEMNKLENKLNDTYGLRNISDYTLGFNKSETLYFWENYSCPNNVFPIFWWEKLKNKSSHETILNRAN
jgi:hypothetical protein